MVPIPGGASLPVLALADQVATKMTQRDQDWATIGQLVDADMVRHRQTPAPDRVHFWLQEAREADQLLLLAGGFPETAAMGVAGRPLLAELAEATP